MPAVLNGQSDVRARLAPLFADDTSECPDESPRPQGSKDPIAVAARVMNEVGMTCTQPISAIGNDNMPNEYSYPNVKSTALATLKRLRELLA